VSEKTRKLKKILIVAYHFPPDTEVGARRPLSFARHLPEHGWDAAILTVNARYYQRVDPGLMETIPAGLPIYRSKQWPNLRDLALGLRDKFSSAGTEATDEPERIAAAGNSNSTLKQQPSSLRRAWTALSQTPDGMVGWYPAAVSLGRRVLERERPDAILATGPPWTALMIGRVLARRGNIPLVADFRDQWRVMSDKPEHYETGWSRRWEEKQEQETIRHSAAITFVTESLRRVYVDAYSADAGKMHAIYNGFEPIESDAPSPPVDPDDPVVIRHLGTLYAGRDFGPILEAVARLVKEGNATSADFRIENYGYLELPEDRLPNRIADTLGIPGAVSCYPPRPAGELPALAAGSDALLTISGLDYGFAIPYKTFEYLTLDRYILAIGPNGENGRIVGDSGAGCTVDPRNATAIGETLMRLLRAKRDGTRLPGGLPAKLRDFSASRRVCDLAALLDQLADVHNRSQLNGARTK